MNASESEFFMVFEGFGEILAHLYCDKTGHRPFLRFLVLKHILTPSGHFSKTERNLGLSL